MNQKLKRMQNSENAREEERDRKFKSRQEMSRQKISAVKKNDVERKRARVAAQINSQESATGKRAACANHEWM